MKNIVELEVLDNLFADFVQKSLGLKGEQVLISFAERGQKSFKFGEDVCYIKFYDVDDERQIYKNRNEVFDKEVGKFKITQDAMRTIKLRITFYGPKADFYIAKMTELFYMSKSREFLYENNMSLIPDRTSSVGPFYEKINERFWHRSDVELYFYNSVSIVEYVDSIDSVDVRITHD